MAYIGQAPIEQFSSVPTKDSFTGDGSTVAFDLSNQVAAAGDNSIEVFVDNVRQEPGSSKAYTLGVDGSGDMKRVTFTAAPASSAVIYVLNSYTNTFALPAFADINAAELVLDADGDTSITADTDDRIDVKVSGTDQIQIADGVVKPVTDSDVDLGTSSLYFKNAYIDAITTTGNVTVGGDLTITGTTSFADTNITNVGSIALDTITNDGTDITLDSGGDIILDADGTQIFLKDAGTTFGSLTQAGGELVIKSSSSDTTALTFAGANATFAGTLTTAAGGIATASLADDAVTAAKMAANSVDSDSYVDASIDLAHMSVNSIDSDQYVDGSIDLAHMSVNSIDSDQYVDGSIDTAHIADNQVTLAKMAGLVRGKIIIGDSSGDPVALTVGSNGQVLKSDGTDISWGASPASISTYTNSTNNRVITSVDSSSVNGEANLTFDGSTLGVTGAATVSTTLGVTGVATFSGGATLTEGTLTDQATVTWDAATDPVAKVTLGANRTLASATNGGTGQFISLLIIQDGTGSRTLTWNAAYEFKDDTAPTLTTTAAKGDLFVFRYNGAKWLEVGRNTALTLS
jgi:hypothetical protein